MTVSAATQPVDGPELVSAIVPSVMESAAYHGISEHNPNFSTKDCAAKRPTHAIGASYQRDALP